MLTIDGSVGEGGGQILRIALAWSALRSEPVRITGIRAKRPKPGLKPQHLTALLALKEITDAEIRGARIGSKEVEFIPSDTRKGNYIFDCGTAGSITLMIQAILPVLLNTDGESRVILRGGTDVKWSPPIDYAAEVFLGALKKMGATADIQVVRRGYYPKGGGEVVMRIRGSEIKGIELTGGTPHEIYGNVHCSNLPDHVPERIKHSALKELIDFRAHINIERGEGTSTGTGITLWAHGENFIFGSSALGERGVRAEVVGKNAGSEIREYAKNGVGADTHLADQLLIYMAMAGDSELRTSGISSHAKTAMELLQKLENVRFYTEKLGGLYSIRAEKD